MTCSKYCHLLELINKISQICNGINESELSRVRSSGLLFRILIGLRSYQDAIEVQVDLFPTNRTSRGDTSYVCCSWCRI